jgi:hypothetical protein
MVQLPSVQVLELKPVKGKFRLVITRLKMPLYIFRTSRSDKLITLCCALISGGIAKPLPSADIESLHTYLDLELQLL